MAKDKVVPAADQAAAVEEAAVEVQALKEIFKVVLLDNSDNVVGVQEVENFPSPDYLRILLLDAAAAHGKAINAKIDKRYTV